jgi:hypothetical protein
LSFFILITDEVSVTVDYPPVVAVDSNVTFCACINDSRPNATKPSFYTITWWDNTATLSLPTLTKSEGSCANVTKVYSNLSPKVYNMQVKVFDGINLFKNVATETVPFTLTGKISKLPVFCILR